MSGATVTAIQASAAGVSGVVAQRNGQPQTVTADYYVCAMPVEIMSALVTGPLKQFAPSLGGLGNLKVRLDKLTESEDTLLLETTVTTDAGTVRTYDAFVLRNGKVSCQFYGVIG